MSTPTQRELALETLLRERDAQVAELTDEVKRLRKHLDTQPSPSQTDSVTLPPALLALLQPLIFGDASKVSGSTGSSTINTGVLQRTAVLQEENDELYELLRSSETGRLKEEVRSLRRVVPRLQQALADSGNVIQSLSKELEKAHIELITRQQSNIPSHRDSTTPPRTSPRPTQNSSNAAPNSRPIPTGPRALKKPRLSETRPSPPRSNASLPPTSTQGTVHSQGTATRTTRSDRSPRDSRMDVEEDRGHRPKRPVSPERLSRDKRHERTRDRDRDKERERERERERPPERDRQRDRDRDRDTRDRDKSRRGASGNGGRGGSGRKNARAQAAQDGGDRSLAQRMGL